MFVLCLHALVLLFIFYSDQEVFITQPSFPVLKMMRCLFQFVLGIFLYFPVSSSLQQLQRRMNICFISIFLNSAIHIAVVTLIQEVLGVHLQGIGVVYTTNLCRHNYIMQLYQSNPRCRQTYADGRETLSWCR